MAINNHLFHFLTYGIVIHLFSSLRYFHSLIHSWIRNSFSLSKRFFNITSSLVIRSQHCYLLFPRLLVMGCITLTRKIVIYTHYLSRCWNRRSCIFFFFFLWKRKETITCGTSLSKAIRDFSNFTIFYSFDLKKKYRMCLRIIFRLKTFQFHLIFHWYSKVCTRFIYIQNCLLKLSDSGNCEY